MATGSSDPDLRLDHVIVGSRDLDATAARFLDDFGLASADGGRHKGWGTANRIVPLGASYIELLGIYDRSLAATNGLGRRLLEDSKAGDRLIGWAVATDDLDSIAGRLGLAVAEGSRRRPDGAMLRWRSAGLEEAMAEPCLPFFLSWLVPDELHPGRAGAAHHVDVGRIAWLEVAGDPARIERWVGGRLQLRMVEGPCGLRGVAISTARGDLVIRP
jgi:glyoxalase-like protein